MACVLYLPLLEELSQLVMHAQDGNISVQRLRNCVAMCVSRLQRLFVTEATKFTGPDFDEWEKSRNRAVFNVLEIVRPATVRFLMVWK